ncbi:MAG: hypothetical protein SGARI_006753, partial [Bacillariaceae sp.]
MRFLGFHSKGASRRKQGFLQPDKDEEDEENSLKFVASVATSSNSSEDSTRTLIKPKPVQEPGAMPRMLETRILIAMYKIRSAIEEIEAARIAGPTRDEHQRNLITAVCSLESAMDNIDGATSASKCLQSVDGIPLYTYDEEEV